MQTPYQNIGEATDHAAFITGADGHDKASILRRTFSPNLPDIPVLDDDGWQRLIHLIDAAPALLDQLRKAVMWLELEQPEDEHDKGVLHSLLHYSKVAIDRATGHPGETDDAASCMDCDSLAKHGTNDGPCPRHAKPRIPKP